MHLQNLIEFYLFVHQILSGNKILTIIKDHKCVAYMYLQKLIRNNPNLDLVNINAFAKFGLFQSIRSGYIERKENADNNQGLKSVDNGQTDGRACLYYKLTYAPKGAGELKVCLLQICMAPSNVNPYPTELSKMPRPLLIFSQSDYLIPVVDTNSQT